MKKITAKNGKERFKSISHKYSPKQEKNLSKKLGAVLVKGSGCGDDKGDVKIDGVVRIECKSTIQKSFRLTKEILRKVGDAAMGTEVPVVQLDFINPDNGDLEESCYVVPAWAMESLISDVKQLSCS